ncbi:MAG TPA: tetratricopeptide repeat protein [Pyrinomonadaceae bacterium]|jgi:tetratricopeptide (TPR) repeat protein|nr:tetratricopeptide repeat protein [Pyrinomonadaceae bacterium]
MNINRQKLFLLSLVLLLSAAPSRAQQPAEAGAAWQVLQYDVAVEPSGGGAQERALKARATITARNVGSGGGRTFTARVSPSAVVESATAAGSPARFTSRTEARTKLQLIPLSLPSEVPPGGQLQVVIQYRLPVTENSGLASISPEGLQFLPLSFWYPTPNSLVSPRGSDFAPVKLTVGGTPAGEQVVSAGKSSGASFDQTLSSQPFFVTGHWEAVEGAGEARGISALLHAGAGAEERKQAEALIQLAAAARTFYAGLLGPAPDAPVRLVGVRRGAGFEMGGTLLLDHAVFRRPKVDSVTAIQVADTIARLWVGGSSGVSGEGAGAVREGLPRFLATLFVEKQYGKPVADAERLRLALLYAPVARRDPPLAQVTPAFDTYFNSTTNKGALVWNLLMNSVGRDAFLGMLRGQLAPGGAGLTLAALRSKLAEAGGAATTALLSSLLDQPTDTDLLVGLPQQRAGGWVSALRNLGSFDVDVTVVGVTDAGERVPVRARIPAKDFGEAQFKTSARLVGVEVDPDKLYPQLDYSNDTAPRAPSPDEAVEQARVQLQQQPARAAELARGVLARSPGKQEARVVLGRALVEQNKLDEAEREFRAALDSPLPTPATIAWSQIGLGEIALRRGRASDAARLFDAAVKTDAEYASTFAARLARLKAEAGAPPAPDEQVKTAAASLDAALKGGRSADIETMIVPGELTGFAKGVVGTQPEVWQTRVLRTEVLDPNRVAADVSLTVRALGKDQTGPAVFVFARTPAGWRLSEIPIFEVK